jgi:hypothetical protein
MHLALNWFLYGRVKDIDTALAEHTHIEDKSNFQRSSKRMSSTNQEMLKRIVIQMRSETIEYLQKPITDSKINCDDNDDVITYAVISNLHKIMIRFNDATDSWYTTQRPNYFHPWLKMKHVTKLLIQYSELCSDNVELIAKTIQNPIMFGVQGISITPNSDSGINKFTLYATNNYQRSSINRYDTVEVSYEDGSTAFVQIHGIISIQEEGGGEQYFT